MYEKYCINDIFQIIKLLDSFPDSVSIDAEAGARFMVLIQRGSWILEQSESQTPCYVIIDEFIKLVHIVLWK